VKVDLDQLVDDCRHAIAETDPRAAVRAVLERVIRDPAAVGAVLPARRQQMTLLHVSDDLTIFQAVNGPGFFFKPHDHGCWSAVALYAGRSRDTFYRRTAHGIAVANSHDYDAGAVALMGAKTIHATHNPLRSNNAAILVFAGNPFAAPCSMWEPDTLDESLFDRDYAQHAYPPAPLASAHEPVGNLA
jgi:predicted metal-dependent enzyme (double-stranded beta helix superfamily)